MEDKDAEHRRDILAEWGRNDTVYFYNTDTTKQPTYGQQILDYKAGPKHWNCKTDIPRNWLTFETCNLDHYPVVSLLVPRQKKDTRTRH